MAFITGVGYWTRITGAPHKNKFNPDVDQWSFDLSVDEKAQEQLLSMGMKKTYLRNKDDERGTFITFTRDSIKKNGSPGKPIEVKDNQNNPWPEDVKIGNGSVLNVIVSLNERTFRGEKFLKPSVIRVQVWDHKAFEGKSDFPVNEDGEPVKSVEGQEDW